MSKSKIVEINEKIANKLTTGFNKMSDGVVNGYKAVENGAVGAYTKIEDKFVGKFLTKDGETIEETKVRLKSEGNKDGNER